MEAREHAKNLTRYFEHRTHEDDREVWRKGLKTAQEWLRLIDTDHASPAELTAFISVVHANRNRTSGWYDLALGAYHWIKTKDIPISPPEVFFAREGMSAEMLQTATPLEQAHTLTRFFEQHKREDPNNEMWAVGLGIVQEWLRLIEAEEVNKSEISTLFKKLFDRDYSSKLWFDTVIGIGRWCKATGNMDLLPDDFRFHNLL